MKKRCFTLLLASLALAQDAPKTMNRITVQLDGSEVPQNSFARKPKTIYRAGSTYCRIEEAPDPEHNIHGLLIVNEPNAWMVNLATKSAIANAKPPTRASLERICLNAMCPTKTPAKGATDVILRDSL